MRETNSAPSLPAPVSLGLLAGGLVLAAALAGTRRHDSKSKGRPVVLGLIAGLSAYGISEAFVGSRARRGVHDSAPARSRKGLGRFGDYTVVGRTVTIDRPRNEIYRFWRDFRNLPSFMENVKAVSDLGNGRWKWTIAAPGGFEANVISRVVSDRENELLSWRSTDESDIDTEGHVSFSEAPGGRGTAVEAVVAYKPPGGQLGRLIATLYRREPAVQGRHELKRLKMLMETGEIATARNHREAD